MIDWLMKIFNFSRHTMMHLYTADIFKVFNNFRDSGSRFLLITSHINNLNSQLPDTLPRWRPVNFLRSPFFLPTPTCVGRDTVTDPMYMLMYELEKLKL